MRGHRKWSSRQISMPADFHKRLQDEAAEHHLTVSALVVERLLQSYRRTDGRSLGSGAGIEQRLDRWRITGQDFAGRKRRFSRCC